jgi:Major capsid protein GP7
MSTDVSQLGYSTFTDIVGNYSSTDAAAKFVLPKRVLDRMTPLVRTLPMKPSNNILSNIAVRTDALPVAGTRRWNEGIKSTASKNTPLNDPIAMFQDRSEVDFDLWGIQNDPNAWRADQDMNHVEGLFQLMESTLLYGSMAQNPGTFNGLATRFNNLESYPNGDQSWVPNVWNGGATTGSVTSAWMIEFGEDSVYGIYPPNTPAGLSVRDLGEMTKQISAQTGAQGATYNYQVLATLLNWYMGIQIPDERCVQRICNINPVALSSANFDENIFIEAKNWLPRAGEAPGTVILVNRALKTQIDIRAVSQKINTYFTPPSDNSMDVFGKAVTKFQNIPIYVAEKILSTETVLS